MSVIEILKKNERLYAMCLGFRKGLYSMATVISPELNTRIHYREKFGKQIDLKNPRTFNEKLLWLKLYRYMEDPLVIQCADKYRVRDYIEQCGCGDILNELYGVYDNAYDIPWENLPEQFVLKWNFGAGMNVVCPEKSRLDKEQVLAQLHKWGKSRFWLTYSEMQYKYIPKKIVCERFLKDEKGHDVIPDYKVYCFHGEPLAILVMYDRGKEIKSEFFDCQWNPLENSQRYAVSSEMTEKPACLEQMLDVSRKLGREFPFVRCDYYIVNDKLYFGELTFTPACGLYTSQTEIDGKNMGEYLNIP